MGHAMWAEGAGEGMFVLFWLLSRLHRCTRLPFPRCRHPLSVSPLLTQPLLSPASSTIPPSILTVAVSLSSPRAPFSHCCSRRHIHHREEWKLPLSQLLSPEKLARQEERHAVFLAYARLFVHNLQIAPTKRSIKLR